MTWILGIILTAIFVILFNSEREKHSIYDDLLDGYWEAPLTFCSKSDLKSAQIYFQDKTAYILVEDADKVLINKCIGFQKHPCWTTNIRETESLEYEIEFDESIDPLPIKSRMRISLKNGLLGLFVDDTLYLELFKNNKASNGII